MKITAFKFYWIIAFVALGWSASSLYKGTFSDGTIAGLIALLTLMIVVSINFEKDKE
jgi:hypothetical protein